MGGSGNGRWPCAGPRWRTVSLLPAIRATVPGCGSPPTPARTRQTTPARAKRFGHACRPQRGLGGPDGAARMEIRAPISHREPPHRRRRHCSRRIPSRRRLPRRFRVDPLHGVSAQRCWPRDVRGDDRNPAGSACLTRHGEGRECTSNPRSREVAPGPPIPCGKAIVASFRRLHSTERCGHSHRPRNWRPGRDVPAHPEELQVAAGVCPRWRILRAPWRRPAPWHSLHWRLPDARSRRSRSSCRPASAASGRFNGSGLSASSLGGGLGRRTASWWRRVAVRIGAAQETGE